MPTLKQLTCHLSAGPANHPLREYDIRYRDAFVEAFVVAPSRPTAFSIHLVADEFIASGLAMFVFVDGVPHCERWRTGLAPGSEAAEFRVRQREEKLDGGRWLGREWRFEKLNLVGSEAVSDVSKNEVANIGTIEVVVLRCRANVTPGGYTVPEKRASAAKEAKKSAVTLKDVFSSNKKDNADKTSNAESGFFHIFDGANDEHDPPPAYCCFGLDGGSDAAASDAGSRRSGSNRHVTNNHYYGASPPQMYPGMPQSPYPMPYPGMPQWPVAQPLVHGQAHELAPMIQRVGGIHRYGGKHDRKSKKSRRRSRHGSPDGSQHGSRRSSRHSSSSHSNKDQGTWGAANQDTTQDQTQETWGDGNPDTSWNNSADNTNNGGGTDWRTGETTTLGATDKPAAIVGWGDTSKTNNNTSDAWNRGSSSAAAKKPSSRPRARSPAATPAPQPEDLTKPVIKPYWTAAPASSPALERPYVLPAPLLPRVPAAWAEERDITHQVAVGRGVVCLQREARAPLADGMGAPYAVFCFKYRGKEAIRRAVGDGVRVGEEREVVVERMVTEMSKRELVEELVRVKERLGYEGDSSVSCSEEEDGEKKTESTAEKGGWDKQEKKEEKTSWNAQSEDANKGQSW